ncbi:2'-5' RNA ligase family protein [Clostridium tagluense]|uniref:2'-5' RNA ligase family protein n=1 Tax=Clostridium tagluense TaxID=360422 RepID=UPI001CF58DF0|nr:2'-5' RNA ligase family protein [Clostridium tagluense]MCB2298184.1 2'-5' RNA ligase family protein [Clostridium tagluense]
MGYEKDTNKLKEHIKTMVLDIKAFHINLNGIPASTVAGNYLFLNVKEDNAQIVEIHKRLYNGILKEIYPQWLKEIDFCHI